MKHISFIFITALALLFAAGSSADAQTWQLGGNATATYKSSFRGQLNVLGGYEFNDKIAIQASLGIDYIPYVKDHLWGAYFRYTPWHNEFVFIDLRADAWRPSIGLNSIGAGIGIVYRFL